MDNSANSKNIMINSEFDFNKKYDRCNYCIVQYEMFNLYVDDEINADDLMRMPSLNNEIIISHIKEIKEKIKMKNIKDIIEKKYNLENVEIIKNEDSTDGNVYNLTTMQKKYILKIYNDESHAIAMGKIVEKLNSKNFYIPIILTNVNNENYTKIDNKVFMIYSFLEGKEIGDAFGNIPNDISKKLAQELRKFHNECMQLEDIKLKEISFINSEMRKSVLHFDLTRGNIFYNEDNKKIGFIDFDDAKYGESIIDVAILITNLYFSKTRGAHIEGVKTFIDEYYKNDYNTKEIEVPLIKEVAIKWINYILDGNEFDSSTVDSLEIRKKLMEKVKFNVI